MIEGSTNKLVNYFPVLKLVPLNSGTNFDPFRFSCFDLVFFLLWQGAGEVVLLNLEDMVTLMLSCNIPGLRRAAGRNS